MCGIFGYIGSKNASKEIVRGLQRLEYRGYDSAGLCVVNNSGKAELVKSVGKVSSLASKLEGLSLEKYNTGIGHTRWATHGKVTEVNCHPHYSQNERFFVVHNGIIENYSELKENLQKAGYSFYGQTDTEVIAKIFEYLFDGDMESTLKKVIKELEGAYAVLILDKDNPNMTVGAKLGSPLVIGIGEKEYYVSSDYRSLVGLTSEYISLEDGDLFIIKDGEYKIINSEIEVIRNKDNISEDDKQAELGEFPCFMLKEIYEQPQVLKNVFAGRINFDTKEIKKKTLEDVSKLEFDKINIIASGTSYHASLMGKFYFEELSGIETDVIVSTEFKYKRKFINNRTLYIFVSQSGETADTIDCLKIAKDKGGITFGVVNVPGSTIARLSQFGLFTHAGMEVGVASTKATMGQITTLLIMALYFGKKKDLSYLKYSEILDELNNIPYKIENILHNSLQIESISKKYSKYNNFFFLGRTGELPIAMEGSLKLKETTYLHSEAYSSGELKHGSIALINENFPTIMINGNGPLHTKNVSSVEEIKSRSGKVIGIISKNDSSKHLYDDCIEFDNTITELNPLLEVVILQLFAYFMAVELGNDVDKPRNLAKSVTVE